MKKELMNMKNDVKKKSSLTPFLCNCSLYGSLIPFSPMTRILRSTLAGLRCLLVILPAIILAACGSGGGDDPEHGAPPSSHVQRSDQTITVSWPAENGVDYSILIQELPNDDNSHSEEFTNVTTPFLINDLDNRKQYRVITKETASSKELSNEVSDPLDTIIKLATNYGDIFLEMYYNKAPGTVSNFEQYARSGFYDQVLFHRLVNNFVIQGGALNDDHSIKGGRLPPIVDEADNGLSHLARTVAMVLDNGSNSATSEFFININDNPSLDGTYTVFGEVIHGMGVVHTIERLETSVVPLGNGPIPPPVPTTNVWFSGNLSTISAGPIPIDFYDSLGVTQRLYAIFTNISSTVEDEWLVRIVDESKTQIGSEATIRYGVGGSPLAGYNKFSAMYGSVNDSSPRTITFNMGEPGPSLNTTSLSGLETIKVQKVDGQGIWIGDEQPLDKVVIHSADIYVRNGSSSIVHETTRIEFQGLLATTEAEVITNIDVFDSFGEMQALEVRFVNNNHIAPLSWLVEVFDQNGTKIGDTQEIRFETYNTTPLLGFNQFTLNYQSTPITFYFGEPNSYTHVTTNSVIGSSIGAKTVNGVSKVFAYIPIDGMGDSVSGNYINASVSDIVVNEFAAVDGTYSGRDTKIHINYRGEGVAVGYPPGVSPPSWINIIEGDSSPDSWVDIIVTVQPPANAAGQDSTTLRFVTGNLDGSDLVIHDIPVSYNIIEMPPVFLGNFEFNSVSTDSAPPSPQIINLDFDVLTDFTWRAFTENENHGWDDWINITPHSSSNQLEVGFPSVPRAGRYTAEIVVEIEANGAIGQKRIPVVYNVVAGRPSVDYLTPIVAEPNVPGDIIIRGEGFDTENIIDVFIGDIPATTFKVISSTEIRASYPAIMTEGEQPIKVVTSVNEYLLDRGLMIKTLPALQSGSIQLDNPHQKIVFDPLRDSLIVSGQGIVYRVAHLPTGWEVVAQRILPDGASSSVKMADITPDFKYILFFTSKKILLLDAETLEVVETSDIHLVINAPNGSNSVVINPYHMLNNGTLFLSSYPRQTIDGASHAYHTYNVVNKTFGTTTERYGQLSRVTKNRDRILLLLNGNGSVTDYFTGFYDASLNDFVPAASFSSTVGANRIAYSADGSRIFTGNTPRIYDRDFNLLGGLEYVSSISNYSLHLSDDGLTAYKIESDRAHLFDLTALTPDNVYPYMGSLPSQSSGSIVFFIPGRGMAVSRYALTLNISQFP